MRRKSGSNLFAVFTHASVVMFLQFIITLSYVLYMSPKITEIEVKNAEEHGFCILENKKTGDFSLTRSLREPDGPCTKSMELSESRMERVNIAFVTGAIVAGANVKHSLRTETL